MDIDPPPPLDREEYIEQEHFFRVLRERLAENVPTQDAILQLRDEILATTRLPMALDILRTEVLHNGRLNPAMARLPHYFTPFQTFVMTNAEADLTRFDMKTALLILERLASYLKGEPRRSGLFVFQFECVARNRLGYDIGLRAAAADPFYDEDWRKWILRVPGVLGTADFADLVYHRSEEYVEQVRRLSGRVDWQPDYRLLFDHASGRIARANQGKDPLYMFAALQRQLDYPRVPRPQPAADEKLPPVLEARLNRMEKRMQLLEAELRGTGIDLNEFMKKNPTLGDDPVSL